MTVLCVVQARMGSARLPGKVLAELAGMPALALQLHRLRRGGLDVAVATSDAAADDAVAALALSLAVPVVRGPEHDVLARYRLAAEASPDADPVVRLTADCPLSDPELVRRALGVHQQTGADHTSNVLARTFPDGFDVEVVSRKALLTAGSEAAEPDEREHVTPYLLRHPERFTLASFCSGVRAGLLRLTLDTADDLAVLRAAVSRTPDPVTARWDDFVEVPPAPLGISVWPRCEEGVLRERRFAVLRDGAEVGSASVAVEAGTGHLDIAAPAEATAEARSWVERWLRMDTQVVSLC